MYDWQCREWGSVLPKSFKNKTFLKRKQLDMLGFLNQNMEYWNVYEMLTFKKHATMSIRATLLWPNPPLSQVADFLVIIFQHCHILRPSKPHTSRYKPLSKKCKTFFDLGCGTKRKEFFHVPNHGFETKGIQHQTYHEPGRYRNLSWRRGCFHGFSGLALFCIQPRSPEPTSFLNSIHVPRRTQTNFLVIT